MATPYPYTSLRKERAQQQALLQDDRSPPEGVGVVLIMPGRVDLVALGHADEHREGPAASPVGCG
ncbi:hypothetical protein ACFYM5_38835 [Streptomyces sp. NPDC006706]|uniref:hypothetical protein n=1 Tax=Streptomyces sp. NPDC006706 TaxID=3364761 RepID=UPI0036A363BD